MINLLSFILLGAHTELGSQAHKVGSRQYLRIVSVYIVDEVHAVCASQEHLLEALVHTPARVEFVYASTIQHTISRRLLHSHNGVFSYL